ESEGQLVLTNKDYFVDWDFLNRMLASLKDFRIDARLHPDAAASSRSFSIKTNQSEYFFYLVGENFWALRLPGIKWLVASKDWSLFRDMNESLLRDRHFEILQTIADVNGDEKKRLDALDSIGSTWSKSIELTLHSVILNPEESTAIKTRVASM